jgi:hypothetical protein
MAPYERLLAWQRAHALSLSMPCRGPGEFRRFLHIALGSQTEVRYLLRLAGDLGYLAEEERGTK